MAGLDWARTAPATARAQPVTLLDRLPRGLIDWEFVITLLLCLGAATSVSVALENGGWRSDMPPLTTVTALAVIASSLIARTRMSIFAAWPLAIVLGAGVVVWQALTLVGPGSVEQRIDAVYLRFEDWFNVAFGAGVSNDPLPFNVLILSLTWLGVFLFGWSVFRWHNAWIGLIPGGTMIFLDLVLVGDNLTGTIVIYMLLGFLLVAQTNLLSMLKRWRAEGVDYPAFINVSVLHFAFWALIGVVTLAWIVPAGPYNTPAPVQSAIDRTVNFGADFVRLAGPLHSSKVIPVHSYSGVLQFDGSISLGDRELMAVTVEDRTLTGEMLLRGAVYDTYGSGGWETGERVEVTLPEGAVSGPRATIDGREADHYPDVEDATLMPLHIEMLAKSVVGTVMFAPGQAVALDRELTVEVPERMLSIKEAAVRTHGDDSAVYKQSLGPAEVGVSVVRDDNGRALLVRYLDLNDGGLGQALEIDPGLRIKRYRSYDIWGLISTATANELRATEDLPTPGWVNASYMTLPASLPYRVVDRALEITEGSETRYDKAKDIEKFLRVFPVDYDIPETPAGRDTVDYFLFDVQRGYFNYHASAMVVMLRSVGVPARLAIGFAVDLNDYDAETGTYIVRDENSYAWPEVYFPEYGWIPFNPSPDRPEVIQPREITPSLLADDPLGLDRSLRDLIPGAAVDAYFPPELAPLSGGTNPGAVSAVNSEENGYQPWVIVALVGFGTAVFVAISLGWRRSVSDLPYPQQVWEKTVRLASWGGFEPRPGQTPHDYVTALGKRHRTVRDLDVLAGSYTASRFGKKETGEAENERLHEMWPHLRGALLGGIAGRVFRRRRNVNR